MAASPKHPSKRQIARTSNRFAGGGVARLGDDFADREKERAEIAEALITPRGHSIVAGRRRIGKSSLLLAVRDDLAERQQPVLYVDLWTASSLEDMTTRLAHEAANVLGRNWSDTVTELGKRLKLKWEIAETPTGVMIPVPTVELRDGPLSTQRKRLVDALDALEELAAKHNKHLGVILDEFQEIERLGSEESPKPVSAMRMVRAAIQHHKHVTYVFAGSDRRLIEKLHNAKNGALYNLGRRFEIGPIPPELFSVWIEREYSVMGIDASGVGRRIIEIAGPRTRDVRTLAETAADLARDSRQVDEELLAEAMSAIVRQRRPMYEADWKGFTALQQNLLRAMTTTRSGLTTAETRRKYALGDSSRVSKALTALDHRDVILNEGGSYVFDDPFFRSWIIVAALPDVGVRLPITYVP